MKNKKKIILERIYRLFELAEEMNKSKREDKDKLIKRYLSLAKRLGEKENVSIPKELKKKFCKKCYSMKIKGKKENDFFVVNCQTCGFEKKYSPKEK